MAKNGEIDQKLCRCFEEEMFNSPDVKVCLANLAKYVEDGKEEKYNWHMEFRGNKNGRNVVDLYCKGSALHIHFQANKTIFTAKMHEKLENALTQKNIPIGEFIKGKKVGEFDGFMKLLPAIQAVYSEYTSRQEERILECGLANLMHSTENIFIVDIEVVVSETAEYCVGEKVRKEGSKPRPPEGDLLALVKQGKDYWFLPIELKKADAGNDVLNSALDEIKTFLNIIYGGYYKEKPGMYKSFKTNFETVCAQKAEIGLLKHVEGKISITPNPPLRPIGLILILSDGANKVTEHPLTLGEPGTLHLIGDPNDPFNIYRLKCNQDYFQRGEWLTQLKF